MRLPALTRKALAGTSQEQDAKQNGKKRHHADAGRVFAEANDQSGNLALVTVHRFH
jgi:hypothetical protein